MGRLHFSDQKEENNLADKNLKARIVNKNGTSAEWEKATSFVPKKGELILYTDLNKIKIGDGVTKVNDLPFLTVPNKTSDLTNDSGYITNTSVDTKLNDKVSKAGDTMTGFLQFNVENEGYRGGAVIFGPEVSETKPLTPYILGVSNDDNGHMDLVAPEVNIHNITLVSKFNGNAITLQHIADGEVFDDAVTVGQLNTRVNKTGDTMTGALRLANDSGTVKGSLADSTDGVALSAEYGARLKVETQAITVCDNAGGASRIKGVKTPIDDTDAANKKYVDDSIPTTQIEELSSAVAKAEPFFVEFTNTGTIDDPQWSANKTFSEIKSAHDTGRLCYAQVEQKNVIVPLIGFTEYNAKKKAIFSTSVLFSSHLNTQALTITEDNLISIERFVSQSQITTTGLLKGDGDNITAAVAGTDYAAANHTHDTYTATEIDAMWNAVTIS